MNETTQTIIAYAITICVGLAITCALYAVFSMLIWSWLAFILSFIGSLFVEQLTPVRACKQSMFEAAVSGCAWLSEKFA